MLFMKSTSGDDGSYNLTVSFALGTDPDLDTVAVDNRVQTALPQLPEEIQQQGLTVRKRSSAICSSSASPARSASNSLFVANYVTINVLDELSRSPASDRRCCSRASTTRCASGSTCSGWSVSI